MNAPLATEVEKTPILTAGGGTHIVLPGQTPEGRNILGVLLKRTYRIVPDGVCVRADADNDLIPGDVFWDSPMNSSVRFESDFIPFKLATDFVINGTAFAPNGKVTSKCVVSIQVADRRKQLSVIGDRVAHYIKDGMPVFSDPVPFETMELKYERAYGGIDVYSNKKTTYAYPRNPLGRGFVVTNCAAAVDNLALPNLEDPSTPLTPEMLCVGEYARWENQPHPTGLGWFPKTWLPRAQLAGILPADRATEQELRLAYVKFVPPAQREAYLKNGLPDMDFRFFNGASSGLGVPFLRGGEQVVTSNLCPEGVLAFQLPRDQPRIGLDIGSGIQSPDVVLHTVMIHMDERTVDLVWRVAVPYPGRDWLPKMQKMEVVVE